MDRMDKEEYKRLREEIKEESKHLFDDEPELNQWVKTKSLIFKILAVYLLAHGVLALLAYREVGADVRYGLECIRPLFQIFWLYCFINPRATWRTNVIMYFWAFVNMGLLYMNYQEAMQGHFLDIMQMFPLTGITTIMELLMPFLYLGVAIYLTVPKQHRILSERVDEIQKAFSEKCKQLGK